MTDPRVAQIRRLFDHLAWADTELAQALVQPGVTAEALREFAHVAGAGETWLSRIERRNSSAPVWPELTATDAVSLARRVDDGFRRVLAGLHDADLDGGITYTNSAGREFTTPLGDILLHVALHAQYHRGKINLLLRQNGSDPIPVDFIGFVRGEPAAVTPRRS